MMNPFIELKMLRSAYERENMARRSWPYKWGWLLPEYDKAANEAREAGSVLPKPDRKKIVRIDLTAKEEPIVIDGRHRPKWPETNNQNYGRLSYWPLERGGPNYPYTSFIPIEPPEENLEETKQVENKCIP